MVKRTITGLYDNYDVATRAVSELEAAGIPHSDISLVANNADSRYTPADKVAAKEGAKTGAGTGASIGTAVGGGAGLLAGLGMLAIPGVGPVVAAGWLVATAVGAAAGAATGGVIGSLTGAGISKEHAHVYAEGVRRGGSLVTARVEEPRAAAAEQILRKHAPVDPDKRGQLYRQSGWKAFDERAKPLTAAELERERTLIKRLVTRCHGTLQGCGREVYGLPAACPVAMHPRVERLTAHPFARRRLFARTLRR